MASSVGGQEAVAQLLETTVLDGFSTGWQLCVDDGSTQWTTFGGSDFMGTPIDGATVFNTYCALKPLLPTLLATMVQEGAFSWDGTVGEHLDAATHLKGVTFRSLLQHRSGVRRPSAVETAGLRADQRVDRALNAALISPPLEHFETLYTESAAWIVLGLAALASGRGCSLSDLAEVRVLEPLQATSAVDLDESPGRRQGINGAAKDGARWPFLIERTSAFDWSSNPGYGGRCSMVGLAVLARESLDARNGRGRVLNTDSGQFLTANEPRRWDRSLKRSCSFGGGWLTDLESHGFGSRLSPSAFASVGLTGMTCCWAEPELDLVVAYHLCGVSDTSITIDWLRPAVVSTMLA